MLKKYIILPIAAILYLMLLLPITSAAGTFTRPVDGEILEAFSRGAHRGIDIAANVGDPVLAAQEGIVYWVGKTPRGEPCISVDHPDGLTTTYLPVEASVHEGQSISAGEKLGVLTADGDISSETPHLHLGLFTTATRHNKRYLDPADYLANAAVQEESTGESAGAAELVEVGPEVAKQERAQTSPHPPTATDNAVDELASQKLAIVSNAVEPTAEDNTIKPDSNPQAMLVQGNAFHSNASQESQPVLMVYIEKIGAEGALQQEFSAIESARIDKVTLPEPLKLVAFEPTGVVPAQLQGEIHGDRARDGTALKTASGIESQQVSISDEAQIQLSDARKLGLSVAKRTSILPASVERKIANPFIQQQAGRSPLGNLANHRATNTIVAGRNPEDGLREMPTQGIFEWKFLPDFVSGLLIIVIMVVSVQSVRKAKRMEAVMAAEPGYCGSM